MTADAAEVYKELATPTPPIGVFDPGDVAGLPEPAKRYLTHALAPGIALNPTVLLEMDGEIKLKRWMPFQARQVLRAGSGFVWQARVGKRPIVFTGGDLYHQGTGNLDFRLWGVVAVARAAGPDIDRSAAGRLAAETVAWAPQALTPIMGATWTPVDFTTAAVTLPIGSAMFDVTVTVEADGRLSQLKTRRWGDPDGESFKELPFGAAFDTHNDFDGVTIATSGRVGWYWGTHRQDEGEFFRYRITDAHGAER